MDRIRPPGRRSSYTFTVGDDGPNQIKVSVGLYPNGNPCEVFLRASKTGTFTKEVLAALSCVISLGLQHGISIELLAKSMSKSSAPSEYCDLAGIFQTIAEEYTQRNNT